MLISRSLEAVQEGTLTKEDRLYPITRMDRYTRPTYVTGVGSQSGMETRYGLHLRVEFVPTHGKSGGGHPVRDVYMKVLPKGSANIDGVLFGYPTLDSPPYGLGHERRDVTHYFTELNVHLPRNELARRNDMQRELEQWRGPGAADATLLTQDGFHLMR